MESIISVSGIHCAGCLSRIETTLKKLGVAKSEYDYFRKVVLVEYDGQKITESDIVAAIVRLGYQAEPRSI